MKPAEIQVKTDWGMNAKGISDCLAIVAIITIAVEHEMVLSLGLHHSIVHRQKEWQKDSERGKNKWYGMSPQSSSVQPMSSSSFRISG